MPRVQRCSRWVAVIAALTWLLPTVAAADPGMALAAFAEDRYDGSRASGLSVLIPTSSDAFDYPQSRPSFYMYYGLTAQQIESPYVTYAGQPDTLQSVYVFGGVALSWYVSPFAEAGFDFGDQLIQSLFDNSANNDEPVDNIVDTYFALGMQTQLMRKSMFVRAYYKWYNVRQEGHTMAFRMPGAAVGFVMAF